MRKSCVCEIFNIDAKDKPYLGEIGEIFKANK